jgi:hypothetical protein
VVLHSDGLKRHKHTPVDSGSLQTRHFFSHNFHVQWILFVLYAALVKCAPPPPPHTLVVNGRGIVYNGLHSKSPMSGFVLCIISYGLGVRYEVIRVETFLSAGFRGLFWALVAWPRCASVLSFSAYGSVIVFRVINFLGDSSGVNTREQRK